MEGNNYCAFPVSKSQDLTKFKSKTPHITHHTIHSHNTYEFEVLQNIKDDNDCFCLKKISKVEQILCPSKDKKKKECNKKNMKTKVFFIAVCIFFILYILYRLLFT